MELDYEKIKDRIVHRMVMDQLRRDPVLWLMANTLMQEEEDARKRRQHEDRQQPAQEGHVTMAEHPASIGRIVHYVSAGSKDGTYPSVCRAAIVTAVHDAGENSENVVTLTVFNPEGLHFVMARYNDEHVPMTWHWPERVP